MRRFTLLLSLSVLLGCGGNVEFLRTDRPPTRKILQAPQIEEVADELVSAARSAIEAHLAPDSRKQWMIPPAVDGDGNWVASALCFAIASRNGRLRPLQPPQSMDTTAAIQAWLRESPSDAVVWMVEAGGLFRPEVSIVICSAQKLWRSARIPVDVANDERFTWPLSASENPPLAKHELGEAESMIQIEGKVYVQSHDGRRELSWHRRKSELSLGRLRPWSDFGRSWITRNVGVPEDPSPSLALMRRNLLLTISDVDLPRGEGEIIRWSLSRGGDGMELPLKYDFSPLQEKIKELNLPKSLSDRLNHGY